MKIYFWSGYCISVLVFIHLVSSIDEPLDRVKTKFRAEEVLTSLSKVVEDGQKEKFKRALNCSCALHACSNLLNKQQQCTTELGPLDSCGVNCPTRKVSFNYSFVTTPPNLNPNEIDEGVVEDSCIYQDIDVLFRKFRGHIRSWVYYGSARGIAMYIFFPFLVFSDEFVGSNWPGVPSGRGLTGPNTDEHLGGCEQYDPRVRPWYLEATSAPRNLIILVDASSLTTLSPWLVKIALCVGSMLKLAGFDSSMTRWELAKEVARNVLSTMRNSDAVTVLILDEENLTEVAQFDLLEGDEPNQEVLMALLEKVEVLKGDKKIKEGFESAFHMLRRAKQREIRTTNCQDVVLLITDGHLCNKEDQERCPNESKMMDKMLDMIKKEQDNLESDLKASIFVMTIGEDRDDRLAKAIACENQGLWIFIHPKLDLLSQMSPFISFFANQVVENEDKIVWSNFYEDFSGLGTMTTGTRPVFSLGSTGGRKGKLLGVIGYDIRLTELQENGLRYEEIVGQLSRHIGECKVHPIDACQLQIMREKEAACPISSLSSSYKCYQHLNDHESIFYASSQTPRRLSFDQAVEFCVQHGGRLAEIGSEETQSFFASMSNLEGVWIGLNLTDSENWSWISGQSNSEQLLKSLPIKKGKNCAALNSGSELNNIEASNCIQELFFLCEFASESPPPSTLCTEKEIYTIQPNQTKRTFHNCLEGLDERLKNGHMETNKFIHLRTKRNKNPVFCPMGLNSTNFHPSEAQCCEQCLNTSSMFSALSETEEGDEISSSAILSSSKFIYSLLLPMALIIFSLFFTI